MKLYSLTKPLKLTYINSDITDEHFPDDGIRGSDPKIYHFDKFITSEDVIKEMDKDGYRPMTIHELLVWAKDGWNGKDTIVAHGSVWRDWGGSRVVASLWRDSDERDLGLGWCEGVWDSDYRFAAVRKDIQTSDTGKLGTGNGLDPLEALTARVTAIEDILAKLKTIL